tara:strand:+ start:699 stop:902 length:204 start_codon:yes stop_codon:yes gene_type:complete
MGNPFDQLKVVLDPVPDDPCSWEREHELFDFFIVAKPKSYMWARIMFLYWDNPRMSPTLMLKRRQTR